MEVEGRITKTKELEELSKLTFDVTEKEHSF